MGYRNSEQNTVNVFTVQSVNKRNAVDKLTNFNQTYVTYIDLELLTLSALNPYLNNFFGQMQSLVEDIKY